MESGAKPGMGVRWTARAVSTFVALFLFVDGLGRMVRFGPYLEGTVQFGYPAYQASWIGLVLVVSTLLYVIPRTTILGAILITGYLGGAAATQVRAEDPWFLFPVALGVLAWVGPYLLDAQLRALIPVRKAIKLRA
jgi:hypothetical protein